MAKWDIKDRFWRMYCKEGQEYNFAYVLPQLAGKQVIIVVPTSLQMGWVESPPFFCAASETAQDVAQDYCETAIGSIPPNKFTNYVTGNSVYKALLEQDGNNNTFRYLLKVYVDDYVALVIPTLREQLRHVGDSTMTGIHDVFPQDDNNNPISKKDGEFGLTKRLLSWWMSVQISRTAARGSLPRMMDFSGAHMMLLSGVKNPAAAGRMVAA